MQLKTALTGPVEFDATAVETHGPQLLRCSLFIDEVADQTILSLGTRRLCLSRVKKCKQTEEVRLLSGEYVNSVDEIVRVVIVVDCGQEPPELRLSVQNQFSENTESSVYTIDHETQEELNAVIDSAGVKAEVLTELRQSVNRRPTFTAGKG